jgi:hypothetical protein
MEPSTYSSFMGRGHGASAHQTKGTQMSDVSNAIATPIAPSHAAGVGTSQPGGHIQVFRAQPAFAGEAKLNVIGGNLWRPGTPGHRFYEEVLTKGPATVQAAIELAASLAEPINEKQVQAHLRWMFTSAGGFLEVDGQRFAAPAAPAKKADKKPATPVKKPKAKAKAKAMQATKKSEVKKSKKVA